MIHSNIRHIHKLEFSGYSTWFVDRVHEDPLLIRTNVNKLNLKHMVIIRLVPHMHSLSFQAMRSHTRAIAHLKSFEACEKSHT